MVAPSRSLPRSGPPPKKKAGRLTSGGEVGEERRGEREEWMGLEIRLGGSHSLAAIEGVCRVNLSRKY